MCNDINDFFEFLGFQDAIEKSKEIYSNDQLSQFNNISGNFGEPDLTKYPYVSPFDCDNNSYDDYSDEEDDDDDDEY